MTAPVVPPPSRPAAPEPPRAAWLSPRYVLPVLGVLLVLAILFTPQSSVGRAGDRRLTTRSAESQGARGLYETLQRLGWRVERRDTPYVAG